VVPARDDLELAAPEPLSDGREPAMYAPLE